MNNFNLTIGAFNHIHVDYIEGGKLKTALFAANELSEAKRFLESKKQYHFYSNSRGMMQGDVILNSNLD